MLYRRGSQWGVYPHKVKYIQHGEECEQWALPSKEWWIDFANKWNHTEIVEFVGIELTDEQLSRFEEIRNMPEDFADVYLKYVLNGTFPIEEFPKTHPFMLIKTQKENEKINKTVVLLGNLSEDLAAENTLLKAQNKANADRAEFQEELIVELAMKVYQ